MHIKTVKYFFKIGAIGPTALRWNLCGLKNTTAEMR